MVYSLVFIIIGKNIIISKRIRNDNDNDYEKSIIYTR